MSVPEKIRRGIKEKLWAEAERLNWASLSASDKSRWYGIWTETEDVGGVLGAYMDPRKVRVYIKDTLLKPYARESSSSHDLAFRVLGIPSTTSVLSTYTKPHGRLLADGRQVAWSNASEWKATLMALHERSYKAGKPFGAVLTAAGSKFSIAQDREVVESARSKLGIEKIVWLG